MLTIRRRGAVFHIRGSVRVGKEARLVKEHSTGCNRRDEAEAYKAKLEAEIRSELLHGSGGRAHSLTIADAGLRWIKRPGGVASYDIWRLNEINDAVGDYTISKAPEAWTVFRRKRCAGLQPATVERFRSVFQSALNFIAKEEGFDAPKIPRLDKIKVKPPRYLPLSQEAVLIESYVEHVQPIALVLAKQGLRSGEAMRLDWRYVNWQANSIFIPQTKTGVARSVTIHAKVRKALHRIWVAAGSPTQGIVFLNRSGSPTATPASTSCRAAHLSAKHTRQPAGGRASPILRFTTGATIGPATA
jgi:integrase